VRTLDWTEHLTPTHTLAVRATCRDSALTHSHFVALKTKDAIVDQLRDRHGRRPDVAPNDPDVPVYVRVAQDQATVYLDLAGEALHRRGWRRRATDAVMKETLAASVLALCRWEPWRPLVDPLCGAGTIPIEAALRARGIAPGLDRGFAFERWPRLDDTLRARWRDLRAEAHAAIKPRCEVPLVGSDRDPEAVEIARVNARQAGVEGDLTLRVADVSTLRWEHLRGHLVTDPPYGDRLRASEETLRGLYRTFGELLPGLRGSIAAVLVGAPELTQGFPVPVLKSFALFNGDLPCALQVYRP
jgi:putative N6-adenine-specific DNA methylase